MILDYSHGDVFLKKWVAERRGTGEHVPLFQYYNSYCKCNRSFENISFLISGFPSCRVILAAMAFLGFVNVYALRVNLSVAIVSMSNASSACLNKVIMC